MAYQVPKNNHPWRQYKNKKITATETKSYIPLKVFVKDLIENYDNIEILVMSLGSEDNQKLSTRPQAEQALWLISMLRKYTD